MWTQNYTPLNGSLALSALAAALPLLVILLMLGLWRKPSWMAGLSGCAAAFVVALLVYQMPAGLAVSSALLGVANGILPIGWIVFSALILYRLTLETGKFEIIKDSVAHVTADQRLQALLVAFAFGALIEGAAGFGTPVAVAAGMLAGLGFSPFYAAGICLVANTSPVAFGSIGAPLIMLATVTGIPINDLSADVGRLCAPLSLFIPAYLVLLMGGMKALRAVAPAAAVCGIAFAGTQFLSSNFISPYLTDILASLLALLALVLLLRFWHPADAPREERHLPHSMRELISAWSPYLLLVMFVLIWGPDAVKAVLNRAATWIIPWPGLHNLVQRVPPVVAQPGPYGATFTLNLLSASGTSCLFAVFAAAAFLRVSPSNLGKYTWMTAKQLALPMVTISSVLGLAFLMNYSGATATLGLVAAGTGKAFPFVGTFMGWLGVVLTGSDTSANALFGSLQEITANSLGLKPTLMAAANSSGGVLGKMISLQNIAVAAAATGMAVSEESKLFRFTLKHSLFLCAVMGLLVLFYTYVMPSWAI
ncbi:MAG TPA: lactate permease LctP family transporter [Bryobacteraceae bacterium]|nr:lactate permease LctP family transporter [Bryobacteraceae bacterium]